MQHDINNIIFPADQNTPGSLVSVFGLSTVLIAICSKTSQPTKGRFQEITSPEGVSQG